MDADAMRLVIERKRDGDVLDAKAWGDVIAAYMSGDVDDAQMAALAMACLWHELDAGEAAALTRAMVESGATLEYPGDVFVIDKHSSGGVSDIVSLVAVPLVAAIGVNVAKLSGRALGHTGGTIDKLEAIAGFNATLPMDVFVQQVQRIGCAIAAQSEAIVPADKRLYHLRDHTGTVPSIGLIASSIVSKKIAAGANAFVFDVKCGSAAFMRDVEQAKALAAMLVGIAARFGRRAHAIVTDMNEPLARNIGTGLEVVEARDLLRNGTGDERAVAGCVKIATAMLELAGIADPPARIEHALGSGQAYEKFVEMIEAQGAKRAALEALSPDPRVCEVRASGEGFIETIDAVQLGNIARALTRESSTGGVRIHARVGDRVMPASMLAEIFGAGVDPALVAQAFTIGEVLPADRPLVYASL
jgi:pyrimidine-nucleoside phosphorylase